MGAYQTLAVCVKSHFFYAACGLANLFWRQGGLDVHGGVRQELYLSYFLAVCVKMSCSGVIAVSENTIIGTLKISDCIGQKRRITP